MEKPRVFKPGSGPRRSLRGSSTSRPRRLPIVPQEPVLRAGLQVPVRSPPRRHRAGPQCSPRSRGLHELPVALQARGRRVRSGPGTGSRAARRVGTDQGGSSPRRLMWSSMTITSPLRYSGRVQSPRTRSRRSGSVHPISFITRIGKVTCARGFVALVQVEPPPPSPSTHWPARAAADEAPLVALDR